MDLMEACTLFEVTPDVDLEELKKKYRDTIRDCHPDLAKDAEDRADREDKAKIVNQAYDCIVSYRNQPVSSAEAFESIFEAFERVIQNYGEITREGNSFTVHVDLTREDNIWRSEEETRFWTV